MKFDVVLYERELDDGLNRIEIQELLDLCKEEKVIPLEIQGEYSVAMGFITLEMAESMNYNLDSFEEDVKMILDDMNQETENHEYEYDVFKMYLNR